MKHLQTKSDIMCDLERAIETKDAFMESLGKQSRTVKLEIQSAMSALYSALRAREMWLLNQVDVIASSQESLLRKQQSILQENVWLLSHKNADYADKSTAITKLKECYHCPSVDLSFLSNIREIKQHLLNFGIVKGGSTLQEIGQEQTQSEITKQQDDSTGPFGFSQNKHFRMSTEESSVAHENVECSSPSSFRFDFSANKFIKNDIVGGFKDNGCFSKPSSDHKVINSSASFYFDFSANKFIQTSDRNEQKDAECNSLSETYSPSSFVNVSPGSFCFDFNTGKFIKADEDEFNDAKYKQTTPNSSKLNSNLATVESPPSFRFDFTANKFIQTIQECGSTDVAFGDTSSTMSLSSNGDETANMENQSTTEVPSFCFCFSENKSVFKFQNVDEAYESNDSSDRSEVFSNGSYPRSVAEGDIEEMPMLNDVNEEDPLPTSHEDISICSFYFNFVENMFVPVLN